MAGGTDDASRRREEKGERGKETNGAVSFVELRAHSAFSFGDGTATPEALVSAAAELGYSALGLTDVADFGGVVRFALAAWEAGITPLIGTELIVDGAPIALLARTSEGCRNIAALITRARAGCLRTWGVIEEQPKRRDAGSGGRGRGTATATTGRTESADGLVGATDASPSITARTISRPSRGRPRVTWQEVVERSAGVFAFTGPASGVLATHLRAGDREAAVRQLAAWRAVFGDSCAVEVHLHHAGRTEAALVGALIEVADRAGVPWVVANAPRYVNEDGRLAHDMLTAWRAGVDLDEAAAGGLLLPNGTWGLRAPADIAAMWRGREQGVEASARIAAACDPFSLDWLRPPLPTYALPERYPDDDSYLRHCVYNGAVERWGHTLADAQTRQLDHELGVIARLGFAGFFLVMWDAARFADSLGILAQGRGSAANSAVAYCLGITAVDPVANGLLFERFLSESRVGGQTEAPDIDIDIEHDRREEVLDYMYGRYDRAHAAITGMVQTYRAPNAALDVMRALGYPASLAFQISKRVHSYEPAEGAAYIQSELGRRIGLDVDSPRGQALMRAMAALEGVPRMRSTHPGGFVLSSAPLGEYLPIEPTAMGRTVVQFDKDDLDRIGVPKFDFLGLGALSLVRRAFDYLEHRTGYRPSMYRLPTDDHATYRLISRGDTVGTFQIESRAQISSIVHTCPERMYDIVVQVALIRPGPIQARFVHPYTRRRRGLEPVTYRHPALVPILARTQGIPIFQEQAMAIARDLGGYTGAQADELRRTMGNTRKLPRLRAALDRLRQRMEGQGIDPDVATEIVTDLQSFANYGFPESHAWSFALIAYATAFLKAHHPAEFFAALLNSWPMGFYPVSTLIHDALRRGVEVRGPCLRDGDWECTLEETDCRERPALRIGWRQVRGVGETAIDALRAARDRSQGGGPFRSIADVVSRAALDDQTAAALARAGAFSAWEPDRRRAGWEALRVAGDRLPLAPARTGDGTGRFAPRTLTRDERIALDYHAIGLTTAGHPMERFRQRLGALGAIDSQDLQACHGGEQVLMGGLVTIRQRPQSAKGTVFLLLEDEWGVANIIISRRMDERFGEEVRHALFLLVYGRVERDGAQVSIIGQRFEPLTATEPITHQARSFR
jgi:error-prone DNA polymerase